MFCVFPVGVVANNKTNSKLENQNIESLEINEATSSYTPITISVEKTQDSVIYSAIDKNEKIVYNQDIENYIVQIFGSQSQTALAVAKCESGLNPNATHLNSNSSIDFGVFQINSSHFSHVEGDTPQEKTDNLFNWQYNIAFAYQLYSATSWDSWTCYSTGKYLKYY